MSWSTQEITLSRNPGEMFSLDLAVRDYGVKSVLVREIHWWRTDYGDGRVYEHLFAVGRWRTNKGGLSSVDARSPVTEDQLPPAVLAKLKELKGE